MVTAPSSSSRTSSYSAAPSAWATPPSTWPRHCSGSSPCRRRRPARDCRMRTSPVSGSTATRNPWTLNATERGRAAPVALGPDRPALPRRGVDQSLSVAAVRSPRRASAAGPAGLGRRTQARRRARRRRPAPPCRPPRCRPSRTRRCRAGPRRCRTGGCAIRSAVVPARWPRAGRARWWCRCRTRRCRPPGRSAPSGSSRIRRVGEVPARAGRWRSSRSPCPRRRSQSGPSGGRTPLPARERVAATRSRHWSRP